MMMLTTTTTATTSLGKLRGALDGGVVAFRGIPYAQPPIGPLRFAPPARPRGWSGTRSAERFGPAPMQTEPPLGRRLIGETDEDCLSLNVWTPAPDGRRRPVLAWLHGGGFMIGAGSHPVSNGAALARRGDVVVVTINYRLGLFGYLRGIDVCGEALPSTGNEGLLDQLAALTWIKEEIAAFGGDPANVTVFGSSAGALSIGLMLAMPRARGLFQKAIMQSAPAFGNTWGTARVMEAILADLGLDSNEAGCLRDLPVAQLLDIQTRLTPRSVGVDYGPVADGTDLPADPDAAIASGSAAGISLLVGTNLEEYKFFRKMDSAVESLTDETLLARLADPRTTAEARDHLTVDPADAVALYRRERASRGENTAAPELWFAIMTDRHFRVPGMRIAELHATHTPATYSYLFTWESPGWDGTRGASHEVNTPFVFGTYDLPDARGVVTPSAAVERLSLQMQDAWVAFARTGSPHTAALPDWEPYTAGRRSTMLLGTSCHAVDAPYETERRFWADART
jgi:para-nitrobenzyl esterase